MEFLPLCSDRDTSGMGRQGKTCSCLNCIRGGGLGQNTEMGSARKPCPQKGRRGGKNRLFLRRNTALSAGSCAWTRNYAIAAATTLATRARKRSLSPNGCVVKRMKNASESASIQQRVPLAPQWP